MKILGISAFYHDAAACLVIDGEIIAAAQEERFTRIKFDSSFPKNSINYCLAEAKISAKDLDYIVFYEKPFLKFERLLETYLAYAPKGFRNFSKSLPNWASHKLFLKSTLIKALRKMHGGDWQDKLLFSEHHLSHAASAFFPSPFERAAILTMDAVGEWATTSYAIGNQNSIEIHKQINFPHSLGMLYSAMTAYLGFKVNSGEYKIMGLAPYGKPIYANIIKDNLVSTRNDGSFALNMEYFDYCTGLKMVNQKFHKLFGGPPRKPESALGQREMDLAASIQFVLEELILNLVKALADFSGEKNLCLAGGVALNCVANGKIIGEKLFDQMWIQPAAGDAGGALGAALAAHYMFLNQPRYLIKNKDFMKGSFLGPEFNDNEIIQRLTKCGAVFEVCEDTKIINEVANALAAGKAVGWMSGRMEFGPRSLGARSIIADPRSPEMQKILNLKIKFRESFRPFAPSVLSEYSQEWFDINSDSPYMLLTADVNENRRTKLKDSEFVGFEKLNFAYSTIPAVTHVDYSARLQTVHKDTNPRFWSVINRFYEITGVPLVVNTSFNVRGEPIVCTPEDAFRCFMGTDLDLLIIENMLLEKTRQSPNFTSQYVNNYELD